MKTPPSVLLARIFMLLALSMIAYFYHLAIAVGSEFKQYILVIVTVPSVICLATLIISFIRRRWSLWTVAFFSTALPLAFWVSFDASRAGHDEALWDRAIGWLIVFPAQMIIPITISYQLLAQKTVRDYYSGKELSEKEKQL